MPKTGPQVYPGVMKVLFAAVCLALAPASAHAQVPDTRDGLLNAIAEQARALPDGPSGDARRAQLGHIEADADAADSPAALARARGEFNLWLGSPDDMAAAAAGRQRALNAALNTVGALNGSAAPRFDAAAFAAAAPPAPASAAAAPVMPAGRAQSSEPPLPPPSRDSFSLDRLKSYLDHTWITDAVIHSVEEIKNDVAGFGHLLSGFAGSCYYGAKWLLIKTGVLPPEVQAPEQIGKIGIGSADAYMMDSALKRDPALQARLHVRRLDLATVKNSDAGLIPPKTIFVFDRGCAHMSQTAGHIEVTLPREKIVDLKAAAFYNVRYEGRKYKPELQSDQILNCSDGCALRTMAFLRTYGRAQCLNAYVPVVDAAPQALP